MNTSLVKTGVEAEAVFYYRPLRNGESWEGPVWAKSIGGKMRIQENPGEWVPLYHGPFECPDYLVITAELDDGSEGTVAVNAPLMHLKILDEMLKNLRRQIEGVPHPESAEANLRAVLSDVDQRMKTAIKAGASAAEAYDSLFQLMVADAIGSGSHKEEGAE